MKLVPAPIGKFQRNTEIRKKTRRIPRRQGVAERFMSCSDAGSRSPLLLAHAPAEKACRVAINKDLGAPGSAA